jgi:hypothetical protein
VNMILHCPPLFLSLQRLAIFHRPFCFNRFAGATTRRPSNGTNLSMVSRLSPSRPDMNRLIWLLSIPTAFATAFCDSSLALIARRITSLNLLTFEFYTCVE